MSVIERYFNNHPATAETALRLHGFAYFGLFPFAPTRMVGATVELIIRPEIAQILSSEAKALPLIAGFQAQRRIIDKYPRHQSTRKRP